MVEGEATCRRVLAPNADLKLKLPLWIFDLQAQGTAPLEWHTALTEHRLDLKPAPARQPTAPTVVRRRGREGMKKEVQGPLGSRSDPLCGKGCKDDRDVASMAYL